MPRAIGRARTRRSPCNERSARWFRDAAVTSRHYICYYEQLPWRSAPERSWSSALNIRPVKYYYEHANRLHPPPAVRAPVRDPRRSIAARCRARGGDPSRKCSHRSATRADHHRVLARGVGTRRPARDDGHGRTRDRPGGPGGRHGARDRARDFARGRRGTSGWRRPARSAVALARGARTSRSTPRSRPRRAARASAIA